MFLIRPHFGPHDQVLARQFELDEASLILFPSQFFFQSVVYVGLLRDEPVCYANKRVSGLRVPKPSRIENAVGLLSKV